METPVDVQQRPKSPRPKAKKPVIKKSAAQNWKSLSKKIRSVTKFISLAHEQAAASPAGLLVGTNHLFLIYFIPIFFFRNIKEQTFILLIQNRF